MTAPLIEDQALVPPGAPAAAPASTAPLTPASVEDGYYEILAGGARYALFLSLLDLNILPLLSTGPLTAEDIIAALGLDPARGRKWLHLLSLTGLFGVMEISGDSRYYLSQTVAAMFGSDGAGGWFHREFLRYYRAAAYYGMSNLTWTLRGAPIEYEVRYPPQAQADVELLHEWMRNSALSTLATIERYVNFARTARLLDVAGGDGTMALELWRKHQHLDITVFNVPAAAELAEKLIEQAGAGARVSVTRGDFRTDAFPGKHDAVMFSRVLADWPPELCRELLKKAYGVLEEGGRLIICEPLADQNPALAIAWEQSYLPYDDFGLQVYKPLSAYLEMLEETGFRILEIHPRDASTIHCVIVAERV
jgi:ubiquinone/menaquinone biosynthesis C-methylase UbiE